MAQPEPAGSARAPLSRERVLRQAMTIADERGLEALTMRSLATALDVRPMSLYHHVASKSAILDGVVDVVFGEMELPSPDGDWREELRRRTSSARLVLRRHSWAIALLESRATPGPATLRHHEAVLATLRSAGFSVEMTGHAYALLDAFLYGFAVQEAGLPFTGTETPPEVASSIAAQFDPGEYPHLVEYATQRVLQPGYDFGDEFEFGLDVVLDSLARLLPDDGAGPRR
ncbi:TetR family transcriptional regulator [Georgenia soli]|uniref:TetR family transcriptional regulator n=1 Tax=Georgenia soli TaxID=638953 RepID=A0A2A9ELI7_9MICO|nr:TetR/AcrR family transcriptional regulator [Georgenia soli]PFG39466.1 TetR family transcriptional regulator [Georgenia soli]